MKIDFLPDAAIDGRPIVRLYDFAPEEVERLREVCVDLATGKASIVPLHGCPWVERIDVGLVLFRICPRDFGVSRDDDSGMFFFDYTPDGWLEVADKLGPFALDPASNGFNWLADEGDVAVLISRDGGW